MKKLTDQVNNVIEKYNLMAFRDVAIFMIILLVFHFLWKILIGDLLEVPFIYRSAEYLSQRVFSTSQWVLDILGVNYTPFETLDIAGMVRNNVIYLPDVNGYVSVNLSCSGLKQFYQYFFLMLLYPGPWKHKLWFIPMGLVIIHFVNIGRIITMTYITIHSASNWDFWHDYVVRPFFYVVMFGLWVWWNERYYLKNKQRGKKDSASGEEEEVTV